MPPSPATAEAAEQAFYDAIAQGDIHAVMALWADLDGAVCSQPGRPRRVGLKAIRASFEEMLAGGGLKITTDALHSWHSADVAVHSVIERLAISGHHGIEVIESMTTNVYVRLPQGWRILLHHSGIADDVESDTFDLDALSSQIRLWIERGADEEDELDPHRPPERLLH